MQNKNDSGLEKKLNLPHSKEFIIECKFDIIKIDEKIPVLEDKLRILNIQIDYIHKIYYQLQDHVNYKYN